MTRGGEGQRLVWYIHEYDDMWAGFLDMLADFVTCGYLETQGKAREGLSDTIEIW
jgi:hypothetical protein